MTNSARLFLFGDLTVPFEDILRDLLYTKDLPILKSFFEKAAFALREEISKLPRPQQAQLPRFTTLIDLLPQLQGKPGSPALNFSLLCLCEIGLFIRFQERASLPYPTHDTTCLLGICTGSFAAAAVGVSQSLMGLVPAGVEAALVAFRTAMLSLQCHFDISNKSETPSRSWSAVISLKEQEASQLVEKFFNSSGQDDEANESKATPLLTAAVAPYLSAVSMTNVTISAPPAVLDSFLSFAKVQSRKLPIESPYHAAHLFSESTCLAAVEQFHDPTLSSYKLQIPLLSPVGGQIERGSFKDVLEQTVCQTLRSQLRWDEVIKSSCKLLKQQEVNSCDIVPIHSNASQLLSAHVTEKSGIAITIKDTQKMESKAEVNYPTGKFEQSKIAVIGFSGRYPDAASNEEFWNLLHEGRDVHRKIPEDRFDWEAHFDPTGKTKNTSKVQHGCFIKEPGLFDTRFFNMSPREAASTDPAQRLLITATYEALEMAGFVPNRTPSSQVDRVGVFMGTTSDDWREVNSGQDVDTYFIPGGNRAFVPGRISYFFKFSGPSLSIDTACSSSFSAIHAACSYLWKGDCDTAIAGGTNILTNPDNFAGLDRGHFLSTTGNCKPFDDGADGYCRADAVGSVILKRYEDAIADNDPIYGMIAGAHTNHCGQAESITRPHEGDQASVFNRVLRYTNQNPLDVSYVEMHGTGTQAGDATEMNSVLSCFVPGRQRTPNYPLHIGSAKANIGHAESASGVSSLIKVLLMMKNQEIPPHCGIKGVINHNYPKDLNERNVHIAFKPTPWTRESCVSGKRTAFLNNFSAAGGNTALLLEDGPLRPSNEGAVQRPTYPVSITAKSAKSLQNNVETMISFLKANPGLSLANLSYTTTARRIHHNFRTVVAGADLDSVCLNLENKLSDLPEKPIPNAVLMPKIAFTFTGQGSLFAGVGKELFDTDKNFRSDILRLDFIAQQHGFPSFIPLIDASASARQLEQPTIAHVGHACIQMAMFNMWSRYGVAPALVVGHSLGEYAALYASGALSATDTIYLVGTRARLLEQTCTPRSHAMVSVKMPQSDLSDQIRGSSEVACINQPDATVLSGPRDEIDRVTENLEKQGQKCVKLDIPYAFHSAQVDPILEPFQKHEQTVNFTKPSVPFLSPMLSSVVSEADPLNDGYLSKACRRPVNFHGALQAAMESEVVNEKTIWVELGPHPLCSGMIKSTLGSDIVVLPTIQKRMNPWVTVVSAMEKLYTRGIPIEWNEYWRQDAASLQVLELPRYGWELKNYWIQYRNNFCLTKGDDPPRQVISSETTSTVAQEIITPSIQRIVELNKDKATMVTETDVNHPALANVISGHKVNGVALCPSSLYADMAMTAVEQFLKSVDMPIDGLSFDVGEMKVAKPLVANGSKQLLRVSMSVDLEQKAADLSFYSVASSGNKIADHATCHVDICDNTTRTDEWRRMSFLINHRLDALGDSVDSGTAHKMKRGIVYKLFGALVDYSPGYRGMQEVTLDSAELEATAKIRFQCGREGYGLNPQWIDSLGHIAGFIMNGNESVVSKDTVFVNHGWDNMQISTAFSEDKTYRTYNKMQLTTNNLYVGDTYILEGKEIVAIFSGIRFQGVPRRVLDQLLPAGNRPQQNAAPPSNTKPRAQAPPIQLPVVPKAKAQSPTNEKIVALIAEAVGIPSTELKPDTSFDECGVDSLLSLNISKMIQDQLNLDVSSADFAEHPTVGEFLNHVGDGPSVSTSGASTPQSSGSSNDELDSLFNDKASYSSSITSDEDEPIEDPMTKGSDQTMAIIRSVITKEVGLDPTDMNNATRFSDLGIDSLLTLNIMSKLGEVVDRELPSMLLAENETLEQVERALGLKTAPEQPTKGRGTSSPTAKPSSKPQTQVKSDSGPQASTHLLQGSATSAAKKLFLFPDGSGSAFSYATLSKISPSVAVYGLACPWQKDPWSMKGVSFSELSSKFISAIQKVQPHGPYHLGGWSAGGISAYDAAQQLSAAGEETETLVLLDSPNPIGLENPPQRMYDFFDKLDFFGMEGKKPPKWLRAHFDAFLTMLDDYKIAPWKQNKIPKTHIVYAKDGVCSNLKPGDPRPEVRDDDPREMTWLLNTRTDFSAEGWKSLVGAGNVQVQVLNEVNHFSMMNQGQKSVELAGFIKNALN